MTNDSRYDVLLEPVKIGQSRPQPLLSSPAAYNALGLD
jgi:hypothetical protein